MKTHSACPVIPSVMSELIRETEMYMPYAAYADFDLTLEILKNNRNNYICIHHLSKDRETKWQVNNADGPVKIWGVSFFRNQNKSAKDGVPRPSSDHLHCGCNARIAVAGFIMWKTWTISTIVNGQMVTEGMGFQQFHPRDVMFIMQFLKRTFGYTVEDMMTGSLTMEGAATAEAAVMQKVANFCAQRYRELTGAKLVVDEKYDVANQEEEKGERQWI